MSKRTYIPHTVSDGSAKNDHPYCCECDFCFTDGIHCEGKAFTLTAAPEENDHVLACSNHIANGIWAIHHQMLKNPERRPEHNVFDSDYIEGHMPDGTGWVKQ